MGKFGCTCGHVISDVAVPNEVTGFVLSDKSFEQFSTAVSDVVADFINHFESDSLGKWKANHFTDIYPKDEPPGEMIHDVLTGRLMELTLGMFECDQCGRLWIQNSPDTNKYMGYSSDNPPELRSKILGLNERRRAEEDAG